MREPWEIALNLYDLKRIRVKIAPFTKYKLEVFGHGTYHRRRLLRKRGKSV